MKQSCKSSARYALTLSPEQARVVSRACELYARLHIGQLDELTWELLDFSCEDCCTRRKEAETLLQQLKRLYFADARRTERPQDLYNLDTERAWDLHQVIRHAIAWHEHPEGGVTVDFRKPFSLIDETLAKCEVVQDT